MPNEPFYSSLSAQEIENILVGVNDSSGLLLRNALGQIRGAVGGQDYEVPPVIQAADPTASTVGVVGQLLINTTRHSLFVCSYAYGGRYTWTPVRINNLTPEEIASIVSLESAGAEYQVSRSGSTPPEGEWSTSIPAVAPGFYLWTRVSIKFSGADPIVYYSVSRQGINGSGSMSSWNNLYPDENGNVSATASNLPMDDDRSVQEHITELTNRAIPSNPNLLDNPWFTVNQRGASSYNSSAYTVDRWRIRRNASDTDSITVAVESTGINFKKTNSTLGGRLSQTLSSELVNSLKGKTVTLSVKYKSTVPFICGLLDISGGAYIFGGKTVTVSNNWVIGSWTFQVPDDISALYLEFTYSNSTEIGEAHIQAIKLEYGSVSTLANDHAPDYATELAKCQHYCAAVSTVGNSTLPVGFGYCLSSTLFRVCIDLPNTIREMTTTPIIEYRGTMPTIQIKTQAQTLPVSNLAVVGIAGNKAVLSGTVSGATTNELCVLTVLGSMTENSRIVFSADL